jgi:ribosomal-protein-alanine N-acetyltransferase
MSAVTVREVTSADIDVLVEFDATLFADDAWPATTWWAELAERPRREYLVLEQDGALLAYGGVDHGGESADIMTVAVVREAQGRGHGAAMLDALEEAAGRRGATGALLEVRADNAPALALYERAGWRQLHVRRRYYQPGDVDALILGKTLLTGPVERGTTAAFGNNAGGGEGE